jgi:carboxymethylenebutenolidase
MEAVMPVHGEMVTFASDGSTAPGYLAKPEGNGPWPGVIVIQEWWGLEEHIKDVARRLAETGFVALAPDLYHGRVTAEPDEARKLAMGMQLDVAMRDIQGAIDYLKGLPDVSPKKIGVVGFCMGGTLTLRAAIRSGDVGAAAPFYPGGVDNLFGDIDKIRAPIFAAFGADDGSIPLDKVEQFKQLLAQQGKQAEVKVYQGAPHSFFNDTRDSYRPEAARDAWQHTVGLFRDALK